MAADPKPVVLYLHGFEENADSPKPASLAPHVDLHVPHLGVYLTHRHSPIRYMLFSRWFIGSILAGIFTTKAASLAGQAIGFVLGMLVAGGSIALSRKQIMSYGVRASLQKSLEIAKTNLKRLKPDAVVGFSWGGCLACLLLRESEWKGPTLLLAPAYGLLLDKANLPAPLDIVQNSGGMNVTDVTVVHSDADTIVPIKLSKHLAERNRFNFHQVRNEKHAMFGLAKNGELLRLLKATMSQRNNKPHASPPTGAKL